MDAKPRERITAKRLPVVNIELAFLDTAAKQRWL
jgi:hypothetical protein